MDFQNAAKMCTDIVVDFSPFIYYMVKHYYNPIYYCRWMRPYFGESSSTENSIL